MKPTPDITKVKFDVQRGTVDRSSAELEINPYDLYPLEVAVRLKERFCGYVTVVSMAPPHGEKALRDALARGADRAILLTDRRFAGADTLATSYTLASALRKLGGFDLVLCGEKSVDGDTGHVGPEVSAHLGIPYAAYVTHIIDLNIAGRVIEVESDFGEAYYRVRLRIPALLALSRPVYLFGERVEPRIPRFSDIVKARRAKIDKWSADDLSDVLDLSRVGLNGSPTRVVRTYVAEEKQRRTRFVKGSDEGVEEILRVLEEKGVLR